MHNTSIVKKKMNQNFELFSAWLSHIYLIKENIFILLKYIKSQEKIPQFWGIFYINAKMTF